MALALLGALVEVVVLLIWQRNAYWNFSSGVYAISAREFLHGVAPYRDFAVAQPPPVLLIGVLFLAVSDTAASLNVGLSVVDLLTASLVAVCVWRIDGRIWLALLAAALTPLLPISLVNHAQLVPETAAAPLILAGALLSARSDRQWLGAALLAVAAWCKVAFLIPAVAVALLAPGRWRTVVALLATFVGLFAASLAAFGLGVWRETFVAQFQVGRATLHYAAGLLAQIAWSELPLLAGAAAFVVIAWRERQALRERPLVATLVGAASGGLLLALTVLKRGSYINVMVVAEPPLLVLATCGAAWSWSRWSRSRAAMLLAAALLAAQSLSLLIDPGNPRIAVRPFAKSGLAWAASPARVDAELTVARRCPKRAAYTRAPYIAFLASRRMPGLQPDLFMLKNAPEDAAFARQAARDRPLCP